MKIYEQVLSREQMARLRELGVDTSDASMCWVQFTNSGMGEYDLDIYDGTLYKTMKTPGNFVNDIVPTYTIGDLIEKLPKNIDGSNLLIEFCASDLGYGDWDCGELYGINAQQKFNDKSLKEALYDLLCWVAENHIELIK